MKKIMKNLVTIILLALVVICGCEVLGGILDTTLDVLKIIVNFIFDNALYAILAIFIIGIIDQINGKIITKKIYKMIY